MPEQSPQTEDDLFFNSVITQYVTNPRFLRRNWLAAEVDAQMKEDNCRFVLLTAEPGAGKSTFMAQLAADHPIWPRYFIRRDQRTPLGDVGIKSFLLRIGYQLVALYPESFSQEQVKLSVKQRIGTVEAGGEAVGAEIQRIIASPFFQKALDICQHVERNAGRVAGLKVGEMIVETRLLDVSDLQNMALFDPARVLLHSKPDARIVILVDAVDELRYHDIEDNILKWLINCPELPANVRIVLTSRPPDKALQVFCGKRETYLRSLVIGADDKHVVADVQTYVERLVAEPDLSAELAGREQKRDDFVTRLALKANGNLGYVDALARAIDSARDRRDAAQLTTLFALQALPGDLEELYAFFLHQIKAEVEAKNLAVPVKSPGSRKLLYLPAWPGLYQPVLGVLTVALAPLTSDQIKEFGGIGADRTYTVDALNRFQQFLDEVGGRYRLFHATLPELLTAKTTWDSPKLADLYTDPIEWHSRIVDKIWETYSHDWSTSGDYGLTHLATHLFDLRHIPAYRQQLYEFVCQPVMLAKRTRTGSPVAFAQDIELALSAARDEPQRDIVQWVRLCAAFARGISAAPPLVIEVLACTGQPVRAQWMAANITFAVDRCLAYALIADHYARSGEVDAAYRMLDEAERTLPAINESHRTMAHFWLVRTALALKDKERARALLAEGERIAFADDSTVVPQWDAPNLLFWLAKSARLIDDEKMLDHIRQKINIDSGAMMPLRNMVLQTMSTAGDVEGLSTVAHDRLNEPLSSVRLANLALALAHIGLRDLCTEILARIDAGAPDHGGMDNPKRHVWARALLGRFDDAIEQANKIEDAEEKIIALNRIIEVANQRGAAEVVDGIVVAARSLGASVSPEPVGDAWRVQTRLASLLLNAHQAEDALAMAEMVARADVPTTLANTLTFSVPKQRNVQEVNKRHGKYGKNPTHTEDRQIPDQTAARQVLDLAAGDKLPFAEELLATIRTPGIRAETLATMATHAADRTAGLALWLRALDSARLAGWRKFEATVTIGETLINDQQVWTAVKAAVSDVLLW